MPTRTLPTTADLMDRLASLCKRRGFSYPSPEIYGGIAKLPESVRYNKRHDGRVLCPLWCASVCPQPAQSCVPQPT